MTVKILKKNEIGEIKDVIKEYCNCFDYDSDYFIKSYFSNNIKDSEKWLLFTDSQKKIYGFCALELTTISDILNDRSRYKDYNYLLSELNKIYNHGKKNKKNIVEDSNKFVFWFHSLCVFSNQRGKKRCTIDIIPQMIKYLKNNNQFNNKEILILADIVENNFPSLMCMKNNGFSQIRGFNNLLNKEGIYFNRDLGTTCYMVLKIIKNKKNKTKKKRNLY